MIVTIYTLPTCPICEMVKKKLTTKGISYLELPLQELPEFIHTDRAPVMEVGMKYLMTPTEINDWIKEV